MYLPRPDYIRQREEDSVDLDSKRVNRLHLRSKLKLIHLKPFELLLFFLYPPICALVSLVFDLNAIASVVVFFGLPALYLTFKIGKQARNAFIFSLVCGILLIIIVDYIAEINNQWIVPQTIFPFRVFNIVPIEAIIWAVLNLYFVVVFYIYFFKKSSPLSCYVKPWNGRMTLFCIIVLSLYSIFVLLYYFSHDSLIIPYFYLVFGTVLLLVPLLFVLVSRPQVIAPVLKTGMYFFYLKIFYEFTALHLGWWYFPPDSQYLAWINISNTGLPLEEVIFWMFIFSKTILSYYIFLYERPESLRSVTLSESQFS